MAKKKKKRKCSICRKTTHTAELVQMLGGIIGKRALAQSGV